MVGALSDIELRPATPADDDAILGLLCATLGWEDDARHRALFSWKHRTNPFGPSPGWVAMDEGGLVGSRLLMRWRFQAGADEITAVRAVDTATHPRVQGRGIFRSLTMLGVNELTAAGIGWVFNTPNAQSAPGYFSMGWERVGHLPVAVGPTIRGVPRLVTARRPADLWSIDTSAGEEAAAVLDDVEAIEEALGSDGHRKGTVHTARSPDYLRWRYADGPVRYRVLLAGRVGRQGVVFFRLRQRGSAREAVIADVFVPDGDRHLAGRLCRRVLTAARADYAITTGFLRPRTWVPVPGGGPLLTWRALARTDRPPLDGWDLTTGDVELF